MKNVLFEASPMIDSSKTGVGYCVEHFINALASYCNDNVSLTGYYFDFLNRNHKKQPDLENVHFRKISLIPGKTLSLTRRLGFQPPLSLFTSLNTFDTVFFTNYVSLPVPSNKRSILAIYDLGFLDCPEYLQEVNLRYMQRFCPTSINRADVIVTISEFTKSRLLHHFPSLTAEIVVTPIPPAAIPFPASATPLPSRLTGMGIEPGKYILFLGTIEPRKNILNLLKGYAELPPEIRANYPLVLAGGKGWKNEDIISEIRTQQDAGLSIIQTGYITDEEKCALYTNATCFVMPSHYEGFGMPILEAMQYNTPVCLSDIAVFREVAGDAALYFDKDAPAAIAQSIGQMLKDATLRKELAKKGSHRLAAFSWENNAHKIADLL